ncbi:hypothetical protein [Micromonospora sp. NPDC050200]|uniref:hypothetical protein n=1 Tax=Micromonospora sp. NPDC050200 TaxID=3155664 RepID=UPI003411B166
MANDAVAGNAFRVAPAPPEATDDPVRGVLAAFTKALTALGTASIDETAGTALTGLATAATNRRA